MRSRSREKRCTKTGTVNSVFALRQPLSIAPTKYNSMCLDIIKYPVKAIEKAKKSKNMNATLLVLVEAAVIFGIALAIVIAKLPLAGSTMVAALAAAFISGLLLVFVAALFLGLILHTIAGIVG